MLVLFPLALVSLVAPFAGAWIEIELQSSERDRQRIVAPFAGAWIEIVAPVADRRRKDGRSLRGSVD